MIKAAHSALYVGKVMHHRLRPRRHRLSYDVFYLLLDLDELDTLARSSHLLRPGRFGLLSFHAGDHGDGSDVPLRQQVESHLQSAGLAPDGGAIRLLTLPRILGYVFNPISVYFCYRRSGELSAVLYEVTNTFGDRHSYLIPASASPGTPLRQRCDKVLHVSPFLDRDMRYTFRLTPPGEALALTVTGLDCDGPLLVATLDATRRELTDRALARTIATYPLLTLKVVLAIHWEAMRLWLKGIAVRSRPAPPSRAMTIGESAKTTLATLAVSNAAAASAPERVD
jgi:DUF1365 family protein